ncbi:MAG: hypothetical protein P4N59_07345 [Negativicutes bacterium]|nr:hypothetical protein [Negativicutes bacterium]
MKQNDTPLIKSESGIQSFARAELSRLRLGTYFRVNVGTGWQGKSEYISRTKQVTVNAGDVVVRGARPLSTGVPPGFPDVIGFTNVIITADMVGKTVPWFTGLEFKSKNGKPEPEQIVMQEHLQEHNCIAGMPRSVSDAITIVRREDRK